MLNTPFIRENITPRGDGNFFCKSNEKASIGFIRENITPRGDGNFYKDATHPKPEGAK